ncbi:MAG: MmcQ/YjbR family DNA-binding protein [Saprospiraceae bacterium]
MHVEDFTAHCCAKEEVETGFPFGEQTLVFKFRGKIFALLSLDEYPPRANLKCDPERALALREQYPEDVLPGYHMNKKHWNTVIIGQGALSDALICDLIDHSYALVCAKAPIKKP